MRNAALSAIVGGITDTVAALSMMPSSKPPATPTAAANSPTAIQSSSEEISSQQSGETVDGEGKNYRMDIQDFIE